MIRQRNESIEQRMQNELNGARCRETKEIRWIPVERRCRWFRHPSTRVVSIPFAFDRLLVRTDPRAQLDRWTSFLSEELDPKRIENVGEIVREDDGVFFSLPRREFHLQGRLSFVPKLRLKDHFVVVVRGDRMRFETDERHSELRVIQLRFGCGSGSALIDRVAENDKKSFRKISRQKNDRISMEGGEIRTAATAAR